MLKSRFPIILSVFMVISLFITACAGTATTQASPATIPANQPTQAPPATFAATIAAPVATQTTLAAPTTTASTTQAAASQPSTTQVNNPGTMIEATIGGPESLDPAWAYDATSSDVLLNVYETLVFPKRSSTTDFVPLLATSWDISQDGKTYTFHIRKGVKFQDGQDLTPQDVAYSFWRGMIQDRSGGPQWIMLQPFFGLNVQSFQNDVVKKQFNNNFVAACQAVQNAITYDNNAGTVTMNLKQPYGPMLQILSGTSAGIVSMPWVIQQKGWDGNCSDAQKYHDPAAEQDPLFKVMNGTGPYMLKNWVPEQETDLVRNDNYWNTTPLWDGGPSGPAKVQNVVIKVIPEWGTRFATFKTGDADINNVPSQYISQVAPLVKTTCDASGNCTPTSNTSGTLTEWKQLPSVIATTIFMNENVNTSGGVPSSMGSGKLDGNGIPANFFSDINVRKAFNYCFDWKTYISQVFNGEAIQAYGPIIKGELGYDPNQARYSLDLTKCADAFKASTLKSADGKSLWDTGFYLQYIYSAGNDQRKSAGDILAANLLKVNPKFHMELAGEPFALQMQDEVAGRMPLFMDGWLEDYHDPNDWVVPYLASGGSYSAYQSFPADVQKQMDTLISQAVETPDTQKRSQVYSQLQNIQYKNALDIFLVQPELNVYLQSWVKGYYYNPIWGNGMYYYYALSK